MCRDHPHVAAAWCGGRRWWAHLAYTRINIELTILKKKIEENLKSTILTRFISGFVIAVLLVRLPWSLKVSRSAPSAPTGRRTDGPLTLNREFEVFPGPVRRESTMRRCSVSTAGITRRWGRSAPQRSIRAPDRIQSTGVLGG